MRAMTNTVRWCRDDMPCARGQGGHGRDSKSRPQMRVYALAVTVALVGRAACPHCQSPLSLAPGGMEVDRTVPGGCYVPGRVVAICGPCNRDREDGAAPLDNEGYARDVERASRGIDPLPINEARAIYGASRARYATLRLSPWWRG